MKSLFFVGSIILLLFTFTIVYADRTVWYVHPDSALNTIQAGLDSCADNDIVLVGPGTYYESFHWPYTAQKIHLMSELGPEYTIIDSGEIMVTTYNSNDTIRIDGFTLQNGFGIFVIQSSEIMVIITDNVIKYNTSGIYIESEFGYGHSIISNNTVTNNDYGIWFRYDYSYALPWASLTDNFIASNDCGIFCNEYDNDRKPTLELPVDREPWIISGNIITDNFGYGAWLPGNATVTKNTISYNGGRGLYFDTDYDGNVAIDSCVIVRNDGNGITLCNEGSIHYCEIYDNIGYGVRVISSGFVVDAEYNWWGDSTGPYHPDSNPGGLGDSVSDHVDFIPWLYWPGVEEGPSLKSVVKQPSIGPTIFTGPLQLPEDKKCRVLDITGRIVTLDKIKPGIYFIEVDGKITGKVIKIK